MLIHWLIHWLIHLYPRTWRDRYEEEFRAVLEQCQPSVWDVLDILQGALDAQGRYLMMHKRAVVQTGLGLFGGLFVMLLAAVAISLVQFAMSKMGMRLEDIAYLGLALRSIVLPAALLPLVIMLHRIFRRENPAHSRWPMIVGLISALTLPLVYLMFWMLDRLTEAGMHHSDLNWLVLLYSLLTALVGVWMLLCGIEALANGLLPKPLAFVGVLGGSSWLVVRLAIVPYQLSLTQWPVSSDSRVTLVWAILSLLATPGVWLWAVWAALRLLPRRRSPASAVQA